MREDRYQRNDVECSVLERKPVFAGFYAPPRIVFLAINIRVPEMDVAVPAADVCRAPVDRLRDNIEALVRAVRIEIAGQADG